MIEGGEGGANTVSGLHFEERVDIRNVFEEVKGYEVEGNEVNFEGKLVAKLYPKWKLYSQFCEEQGVNWEDKLSKRLLPDEAVHVLATNELIIIEIKFQKTSGSVDEKLQTCDYKRKRYQELVRDIDVNVEYMYVLNDWFKDPRYEDTLNYVKEVGCEYYFETIPLQALGLPSPDE